MPNSINSAFAQKAKETWGDYSLISEDEARILVFAPNAQRDYWILATAWLSLDESLKQKANPNAKRCEYILKLENVFDLSDEMHQSQFFFAIGALIKASLMAKHSGLSYNCQEILVLKEAKKLNARLAAIYIRQFTEFGFDSAIKFDNTEVFVEELTPLMLSEISVVSHFALNHLIPKAYNPFREPLNLSDYWGILIPREKQLEILQAKTAALRLQASNTDVNLAALTYAWGFSRGLLTENAHKSIVEITKTTKELASPDKTRFEFVPTLLAAAIGGVILPNFSEIVKVFLKPNLEMKSGKRRMESIAQRVNAKLGTNSILADDPDYQDEFFSELDKELKVFFDVVDATHRNLKAKAKETK